MVTGFGLVTPANAILDKTRFVGDLGIAYYCFHHWVSKPYKAGAFAAGAPHKTGSIIKAGAALLFALNRVKAANKIAHTSKDPLLQKFAGGLDNMIATIGSMGNKFKSGKMEAGDTASLDNVFGSFNQNATSRGLQIKDQPVAVPGL